MAGKRRSWQGREEVGSRQGREGSTGFLPIPHFFLNRGLNKIKNNQFEEFILDFFPKMTTFF